MQSANFDSSDAPERTYRVSTKSRAASWRETFDTVVEAYVVMRSYQPLAARDYDPYRNRRTSSWTADVGGWLADCERITEEAIGGDIALEAGWFALASGEAVPARVRAALYRRCGQLYLARHLNPSRYSSKALLADGQPSLEVNR